MVGVVIDDGDGDDDEDDDDDDDDDGSGGSLGTSWLSLLFL